MFCQFANPSELKRSDVYVYFETKWLQWKRGFFGWFVFEGASTRKKKLHPSAHIGAEPTSPSNPEFTLTFLTLWQFFTKKVSQYSAGWAVSGVADQRTRILTNLTRNTNCNFGLHFLLGAAVCTLLCNIHWSLEWTQARFIVTMRICWFSFPSVDVRQPQK